MFTTGREQSSSCIAFMHVEDSWVVSWNPTFPLLALMWKVFTDSETSPTSDLLSFTGRRATTWKWRGAEVVCPPLPVVSVYTISKWLDTLTLCLNLSTYKWCSLIHAFPVDPYVRSIFPVSDFKLYLPKSWHFVSYNASCTWVVLDKCALLY